MKYDAIFFSPHFDDAAVGVGGQIFNLKNENKTVLVINVFTKAGKINRDLHGLNRLIPKKYKNSDDWYQAREREDKKIFEGIGVKTEYLDFKEAAFRGYGFKQLFSNKIYPKDLLIFVGLLWLFEKSKKILSNDGKIYFAGGLNGHLDHVLVSRAGKIVFGKKAFFWDDRYKSSKEIGQKDLVLDKKYVLDKSIYRLKHDLLAKYKTEKLIFSKVLSEVLIKKEAIYQIQKRRGNNMFWEITLGFFKRELKMRYSESWMGPVWIVLYPLLSTMIVASVFTLVFERNIDSGGSYFLYVFSGMIVWVFFSQSMAGSVRSLINNRELVSNVNFDWRTIIMASLLVRLLDFGVNLTVITIMIYSLGFKMGLIGFIGVILLSIIQIVFMFGVGLIVATANVFYRDVQNLIDVVLQLMYFSSPVVIPMVLIPEVVKKLMYLNPVTILIISYRELLLEDRIDWLIFLLMSLVSVIVFIIGNKVYKRSLARLPELM